MHPRSLHVCVRRSARPESTRWRPVRRCEQARIGAVVLWFLFASRAIHAAPPLPPVATWTETGVEAAARKATAGTAASLTFPEQYPDAAPAYLTYLARLHDFQQERERGAGALSAERAHELLQLLYEDQGHPLLTARWQGELLIYFAAYGSSPSAMPDVRRALSAGLMEFYAAGGGQGAYGDPVLETKLANALLANGIENDEADAAAVALQDHASQWAGALSNPAMQKIIDHYGRRQDRIVNALRDRGIHTRYRPHSAPPRERDLEPVIRRIAGAELLTDNELFHALARCTRDRIVPEGETDVLLAALTACRDLLDRRPMIRPSLGRTIEDWLLDLAQSQVATMTSEHWQAWAVTVGALDRRASDELRRRVNEGCATALDPALRRAMCAAGERLRRPRSEPNTSAAPPSESNR